MAPHATANGHLPNDNGHNAREPTSKADVVTVHSPHVQYTDEAIHSRYTYHTTAVTTAASGEHVATPRETAYDFKVGRRVGRVGVLLVGWGGNNGSTVTAGVLANRRGLTWPTRDGAQAANYYGSLVMGSTVKLGTDAQTGADVNVPFHRVLPMAHPNDLVIGGWDISSMDLAQAMDRAKVLEPSLKTLLKDEMAGMKPLKSLYYPDFIAANQQDRADNVYEGEKACWEHVTAIKKDISDFKGKHCLDKVIVLWTATTERFAEVTPEINGSASALLESIKSSHEEIAPSTVFAVASILEGAPFINGSPQNTFVPGVIELAEQHGVFVGGDDFKSGQTKLKSALVDFLIGAGLKLTAIASYNHLGNNDGRNLSAQRQFRSKEVSKSNVVDDMVAANRVLYKPGEQPDHTVVIKYLPAVGDDKRALDEYYAEIFLGGRQSISLVNVCEDSLLAAPLILDLVLLTELMTRITWRLADTSGNGLPAGKGYKSFHSVLSVLSYMLKAPLTPPGTPVVNALGKQRAALTNIFRACIGLQPESDMTLEHKLF